MKRFVFILRDPGAYAAIYPVFLMLQRTDSCKLFCFGTAATMNANFATSETTATRWIEKNLHNIDVLVCGTGFQTEIELSVMQKCKQQGIHTIAILDYWSNYKNRFSFHDTFIWPDIYVVMDSLAKNEAIEDGVPASIIKVLGHPGLDEVLCRQDRIVRLKTGCSKDRVLLLGEPLSGRKTLGYDTIQFFNDCIDILMTLNKPFSIKFHPRDDELLQRKYSAYRVAGNLLDIASQSDIVIGMTTIALLHCSLLGKTVISYQPNLACKDGCISNKLGLSKLIISRDELLNFLSQPIFEHEMNHNDLIWLDGKSTVRVAHFLKRI